MDAEVEITPPLRPIPGRPGYHADAAGRIWSTVVSETPRRIRSFLRSPKMLPSVHLDLPRPGMTYLRRQAIEYVHLLVLEAFVGPRPGPLVGSSGWMARWVDGDRRNVAPANLAWYDTAESTWRRWTPSGGGDGTIAREEAPAPGPRKPYERKERRRGRRAKGRRGRAKGRRGRAKGRKGQQSRKTSVPHETTP